MLRQPFHRSSSGPPPRDKLGKEFAEIRTLLTITPYRPIAAIMQRKGVARK
jgi:hypothetical protein